MAEQQNPQPTTAPQQQPAASPTPQPSVGANVTGPRAASSAQSDGARIDPPLASQSRSVRAETPEALQDDLDRVREIIMGGGERTRQPLREAEIERLRDVLFGSVMEEYERRFADLRREIERVQNDLKQERDAMAEFREGQRERIDAIERDTRQAHDALEREVDKVRSQGPVLQSLIPQTRQLQVVVNGYNQELSDLRSQLARAAQDGRALRSTIEQYRDQLERSLDTLKREKRQSEDELKEELRRASDRLDDRKTDRKALAAVLTELAARLEAGFSTGIVEDVSAPAEE